MSDDTLPQDLRAEGEARLQAILARARRSAQTVDQTPASVPVETTNELLESLPSPQAELLRLCAVSRWFDREVLAQLWRDGDIDTALQAATGYSFIRPLEGGRYVCHESVRTVLLDQWRSEQPSVLATLHQKLAAFHAERAASYRGETTTLKRAELSRNEALYHLLALDLRGAQPYVEALIEQSLTLGAIGQAEVFIQLLEQAAADTGQFLLVEERERLIGRINAVAHADNVQVVDAPMPPSVLRPGEYTLVELPLITQLIALGWQHLIGDVEVPSFTEREHFGEVLLKARLRRQLLKLNPNRQGKLWLDEGRLNEAADKLERLSAGKLLEGNEQATQLLITGVIVEGDAARQGKGVTIQYIDFEHPENNDFLVINQFRVNLPGGQRFIVADAVLFVNGIPLVVVECKSPDVTDPIEEAITQLLRYSNQRGVEGEGVERLFLYNQLLIALDWFQARVGTIGASPDYFLEWKDPYPWTSAELAADLGVGRASAQQILVAGMLRPEHLLDLLQNFTLFSESGGRRIKILARYQQFRAVQKAVRRLLTRLNRTQHGEQDQRGGIIWHTQGSGKSLTMVFLVRKMRRLPTLRVFKIVVVTDRTDLQQQLSATAHLTGERVQIASDTAQLKRYLREEGPDLVFAMIQKYQVRDEDDERVEAGESSEADDERFEELNKSKEILVLVDEAHRSHTNTLHANLRRALPNSARIGFTGTPIMLGARKPTSQIFGEYIDRYTIREAEQDGAIVPIHYEGRTADAAVDDGRSLDQLFEDMFRDRSFKEQEALKKKYATTGNVLEAQQLISAKATDMLRHYVSTVLPNGTKAQVVASSRRAAVRYQRALVVARDQLLAQIEALDPALLTLSAEELERQDPDTQLLVRAHQHLGTIRRLAFAAIISGVSNDVPELLPWIDPALHQRSIAEFKKPLFASDPHRQGNVAFLCVKSMLLTGFDAPIEQVLYLDRRMQGHELLQAIARVNRTYQDKTYGIVVDYFGVAHHLQDALIAYSAEDIQGALANIDEELPRLDARHQRVLAFFNEQGIPDINDASVCVDTLKDVKRRAQFTVLLRAFLESLDAILPRPQALPYVRDARTLGFINRAAANLYRDEQLNLVGAGQKVRELIDEHLIARGVDPKVLPVSILDKAFDDAVQKRVSDRAKASEMEHAARYHIEAHFEEDPARYRKLSERLEEILQRFQDNWADLVAALQEYTHDYQAEHAEDERDPDRQLEAKFLRLLLEEQQAAGAAALVDQTELARRNIDLVAHLRREVRVVDFWRNTHAQESLRRWVVTFLDNYDLIPFERQQLVADRVMELARHQHTSLVGTANG